MAYAANDLVYVYTAFGDSKRTLELLQMAIALWRELGNQPMLTDSLVNLAGASAMRGNFAEALRLVKEPLAISQALDNKWAEAFSLSPQILVYRRYFNHVQLTLDLMDQGIKLAESVGFTGMQTMLGSHKAQTLTAVGAYAQARQAAQQARHVADSLIPLFSPLAIGSQVMLELAANKLDEAEKLAKQLQVNSAAPDVMNQFMPELAMGHLAIAQHRFADAEQLSREVLALLAEQTYVVFQPEFYYLHGLALVGLDRVAEARETLMAGLKVLRETNGRLWYLEIATLLLTLEEDTQLRQEARATLEQIIEQIPQGELRASFLTLPVVRQLLA